MRANLKTLLAAAVIATGVTGRPALYAYGETPKQASSGTMRGPQGGMMDGGSMTGQGSRNTTGSQGGMMSMMQQMSQMMNTCNQMMKAMAKNHSLATPKQGKNPDKKG